MALSLLSSIPSPAPLSPATGNSPQPRRRRRNVVITVRIMFFATSALPTHGFSTPSIALGTITRLNVINNPVYKPTCSTNLRMKKPSQNTRDDVETPSVVGRRIKASVRETGLDSMSYYLKSMGNHELLQKNEEIILAREIQLLIGWEGKREELESEL